MTQEEFSKINRERCEAADGFNHKLTDWSLSDWIVATLGELGEAANVLKKMNRLRDNLRGFKDTPDAELLRRQFADELADADIYLDLLFQAAGINREEVRRRKFNDTTLKHGLPERFL